MPADNLRPAPMVTRDSAFFWEAAKREELVAQACAACGSLRMPPRPMCPVCQHIGHVEQRLSGRGTVYTWVIPRYPVIPGFEDPPIVAVIHLEEGIRMVSNLRGIAYEDVVRDLPVELEWEAAADGFRVPVFRPSPSGNPKA